MSSMLSSPNFRLRQNEASQEGSPDQLRTGATHSSSLTDSSKRVSTRIPEGEFSAYSGKTRHDPADPLAFSLYVLANHWELVGEITRTCLGNRISAT